MKTENEVIGLLIETAKGLSRNGVCLYPGCPEPPDGSHLIAKSILKPFAEQSMVSMWDPKEDILVKNARSGEDVKRIYDKLRNRGVETEVTWPLFCRAHDSCVFRPLENKEVAPDAEQAVLLAYRALCYKTHIPRLKELLDLLLSRENPEKVAENMQLFASKPLRDARERVGSMVVASDYTLLRWESVRIPIAPCIASTDAFIPITENEDINIQSSTVTLSADDVMTLTISPKNQDETLCVITYFEWSKRGIEYIASLKLLSQNEQYQFLMETAFTQPNIFISPVWWRSLSNEERQYLTDLQLANMLATRNLQTNSEL